MTEDPNSNAGGKINRTQLSKTIIDREPCEIKKLVLAIACCIIIACINCCHCLC